METEKDNARGWGLYVHVPFCARKCPYCAFYSVGGAGEETKHAWLKGVEEEIRGRKEREGGGGKWRPWTVYVGGGTPTALGEKGLGALAELLHREFDLGGVAEWTVEANPGTFGAGLARKLKAWGGTRVSIGAQSFDDGRLAALGRIHGAREAREAVEAALGAGLEASVDVMYGVPGEGTAAAVADARAAMATGAGHVSCYALELEEGTRAAREWGAVDGAAQRESYEALRSALGEGEFAQYELSNWARPGKESKHNGLYWRGGEYLGLGPSAHSHWRGRRRGNTAGLPRWRVEFEEELEPEAKARETLVFGLRRTAGWTRAEFRGASGGWDWDALRGAEIARCVAEGRLVREGRGEEERLRLAEGEYFVSDGVFRDLV